MRKQIKNISRQTISTAVFEYLQSKGYEPDRKAGINYFMDAKNPMANVVVKTRKGK